MANGRSGPNTDEAAGQMAQLRPKFSDSMFSVNSLDSNKLKIDLFGRVGKVFKVDRADYGSFNSYAPAVKQAIAAIKSQAGGAQTIAMIEKSLGLDKLGVSLETVVDAMGDPGGDADDKLDAALRKQTGEAAEVKPSATQPEIHFDELGIYAFHNDPV
ncbi:hypothetical protein D3227_22875 [Mesorhizobium waimense]|uniref:Uncharacterized protein n=2 Tax=Mesorhizobium waimense TaxID=1300307 RepID=A0A3A5KGI9_9HYPH|nr:hypothetical protein D3227_22875 [Mesorhizobium waimense]